MYQFYIFLGLVMVVLATVPLMVDAARRSEYGRRPLFFGASIILVLISAVWLLLGSMILGQEVFSRSYAAIMTAVSLLVAAILVLEYSVHQQRIHKNHLWPEYKQGIFKVFGSWLLALIITVILLVAETNKIQILNLITVALSTTVLVFNFMAIFLNLSLNGMQDGVIRKRQYPFAMTSAAIIAIPLLLFISAENPVPLPLFTLMAIGLVYLSRAYHEYFFYRMNHLSESYRKQNQQNILRTAIINQVLTSTEEEDKAIIQDTVRNYLQQLHACHPNPHNIFKSMVLFQTKGTKLAVRSPDFIFGFCAPLLASESVKRLNPQDAAKHIMATTWSIPDLKNLDSKTNDFVGNAIKELLRNKSSGNLKPLPDGLASMYKLIHLVPVFNQDELMGMMVLYKDKDASPHVYPQEDVILRSFSETLSILFTIINGKEVKEERNRLTGEMNTAKNIQTSILPATIDIPGYEACAVMQTATEVGGDLYDHASTKTQRFIDIGDVSGHGLPSGLMALIQMSAFQSCIFTAETLGKELDTSDVYDIINKTLVRINRERIGSDKFMTCNILSENKGVFSHAGAHLPALVFRTATGQTEELPGMTDRTAFLGISPHIQSKSSEGTFKLDTGDILVLYTDGLIEARDREGRFFGFEGVEKVLRENIGKPVLEIQKAILAALADFCIAGDLKKYGGTYADDVSIILMRKI